MNPEEIEVGETYNVRMKLELIDEDGDFCFRVGGDGFFWLLKPTQIERAVFPLSAPADGTKNTEPSPKYDPCRKFRKGDEVSVTEWNGRSIARIGQIGYVESDENNSRVELSIDGWKDGVFYPACHLELVTPVEEMSPYSVETCQYGYTVNKGEDILATYNDEKHPHAKEAAEAECARLNAEYRKEQE